MDRPPSALEWGAPRRGGLGCGGWGFGGLGRRAPFFPNVTTLQQRPLASLRAAVSALAFAGSLQLKRAPPRVAISAHVLLRTRLAVAVYRVPLTM